MFLVSIFLVSVLTFLRNLTYLTFITDKNKVEELILHFVNRITALVHNNIQVKCILYL
jgi:hypothetical protein